MSIETMRSLAEIAALEEGRQARAIADVAQESQPIAGGIMSRGKPGTWCNAAVGLGLSGPVETSEVPRLIDWYEEIGVEPRVELCPFAHPSLRDLLADHGFIVRVFENSFFRALGSRDTFQPMHALASHIEIRQVSPSDAAAVREYGVTVATGFAGGAPREEDIDLMARCAVHVRTTAFGAYAGGRCIAGGGVEVSGPVAALFGLSVLPEFRRRGVQQALIAARLAHAVSHGALLATISSRPGVATENNVRRMGFQVAYTKVALVRPGPGLVPVNEL